MTSSKCSNRIERFQSLYELLETVTKKDKTCKSKALMFDKIVSALQTNKTPRKQIDAIKKIVCSCEDLK